MQYTAGCVEARLQTVFGNDATYLPPLLPQLERNGSVLEKLIDDHGLNSNEVIILMMALVPHLQVEFF